MTYRETADTLQRLPQLVTAEIERRQLTHRDAAALTGVPKSVIGNIMHGAMPSTPNALRLLRWLADAEPEPRTARPAPDTLSPAARAVWVALSAVADLGECYLRDERGRYGLILPDGDGTLGELHRERGILWSTWGEIAEHGLARLGVVQQLPAARGPRGRSGNKGWPIMIITDEREDTE